MDFEEHARSLERGLHGYFLKRGFTRDEAEELTQETFLRAHRAWSGFRQDGKVKNWFFKIAKNVANNFVRSKHAAKRSGKLVPLENEEAETQIADDTDLNRTVAQRRLLEKVGEAMENLPPRMRNCVLLRCQGWTYKEIAQLTKVSIDTVKSQLHEAKRRLREELSGDFDDFDF